jgi:hypothetical protein
MDDGEATTADESGSAPLAPPPDVASAPTPASSFAPPPMPVDLPPPAVAVPTPTSASNKRRFPWITVVVGVVAVAAIVVLAMMLVSASSDKDDAQHALADSQADLEKAHADLTESEAALKESEAALTKAEADLSDAESARDEHGQEVEAYDAATIDFLAASLAGGLELDDSDARCLAEGMIAEGGADAWAVFVNVAIDGSDATDLDETMRKAGEACGISDDTFAGPPDEAFEYGDDPELDALYDDCAAGDGAACDNLYLSSAAGSAYEQFAGTCGDRFEYSDTEPCDGRM